MEELPIVALGCLLHDIGKVVQRADENPMKQSHSKFGFALLENSGLVEANKKWQWVLESVRYHHWKDIKEGHASLPIAWFAFEADNLASAHDRRNAKALFDKDENRLEETENECTAKWDPKRRLDSIFANFKRRNEATYATKLPLWFRRTKELRFTRDLYPYPELSDTQGDILQSYQILRDKVLSPLLQFLKSASPDSVETVNATLHYLEENLSMVPPDTFAEHTNDVSLFDHLKLTAAIGSCMYAYVHEKHSDWLTKPGKQIPWDRGFRKEPAYLLVKADMSGIQDFIYNVSSKSALKSLRGRSFFLELLQAHLSDHILGEMNLSRANLLYQGGGGFVLLLPNTQKAIASLEVIRARFNDWLFETHKGRLFLALEWAPVTGEQLRAGDSGSQSMVNAWCEIATKIGQSKGEKFKSSLVKLFEVTPHIEECLICHRDDQKLVQSTNSDSRDTCYCCRELIALGKSLPDADFNENGKPSSELKIGTNKDNLGLLPNFSGDSTNSLSASIKNSGDYTNGSFVLHNFDLFKPPKLFWSLYEHGDNEFVEFARAAEGVERIAVLRADVDNLGKIFSGQDKSIGLPSELRSISRDAAVSRALARFFSHYLDDLLRSKRNERGDSWSITTVYAGGDDVFLVGAWSQIVDFALILQEKFDQYTCGRLTLSAGIAIQKPKYPFYKLAQEAQEAEHEAKLSVAKNSLCVRFDERFVDGSGSHNYGWSEWSNTIKPLVETMTRLSAVNNISRGFWNDLLVYSRSKDISFYRLLYSIARAEEANARLLKSDDWLSFKKDWLISLGGVASSNKKARLETALNWFILLTRDGGQARNERDEREVAAGVR